MGRRFFIILALTLLSLPVLSQERVQGRYAQESITSVLQDLQTQLSAKLYYNKVITDTLAFTGSFDNQTLSEALDVMFENTQLKHFERDGAVFIMNDVYIITSPKIAELPGRTQINTGYFAEGLLFEKEYKDTRASRNDLENYVNEIGKKSDMIQGRISTIRGNVVNGDNGEALEGAVIYTQDGTRSAITDELGNYELELPNGRYTLFLQYLGMKTTKREVVLFSDGNLNVFMEVDVISLRGITIESDREVNVESVQMGLSRIDAKEVKNMPVVLGERDLLKVATTMAGVQTIGEGAAGFNIRGGKSDQNLIMLDGSPIYNTSHFFGFFSIFNSDAIESLDLYKSAIPAKHGGRLSSVFDITSRNANREEFKAVGGISPITTNLTVDVPLQEGKAGLLFSGRTTYSNWVLKRVENAAYNENRVAFDDALIKYDADLNEKNKIAASVYASRDEFRIASDTLFSFSTYSNTNALANLSWKHQFNPTLDGEVRLSHSRYRYDLSYDESLSNAFVQDFGIKESSMNASLSYYPLNSHQFEAGVETKSIQIQPGNRNPLGTLSLLSPINLTDEKAWENTIYFSDEININDDISLYGGLRYTLFSTFGPQAVKLYGDGGPKNESTVVNTINFNKGEAISNYNGPEIRISGRMNVGPNSSIKGSYNKTRQYVHALSNSASLSPTDIWRISNYHIKPQIGDQFSLGYYLNLLDNDLETSAEVYYKSLDNLLDFKVGGDFLLNQDFEQVTLQGTGRSYGLEFSLKKSGKLSGWLNYTYSRTFLKIDGTDPENVINDGDYYPASFDMPHSLNLVANYKITWRLSFSYNLVFNSGRPVTYPVGIYDYKGIQAVHYANRNSYRIPYYMRMDVGFNLEAGHRKTKFMHSYWSFSIYNLLGRDNPYSVFFDIKDGKVSGYQLVIFGSPIPTLSYNFIF